MFLYEIIIVVLVLFFDIGSKYWVCSALGVVDGVQTKPDITAIKNVFSFSYSENTGASWGMFAGKTTALTVFTAIGLLVLFLFLFFNKKDSKFFRTCLVLILAGGLGNLYDRIAFGFVRDFIYIEFMNFPTFNIADSFLTVSTILVVIYAIFIMPKEITEKQKKQAEIDKYIPIAYPYDAISGKEILPVSEPEPIIEEENNATV